MRGRVWRGLAGEGKVGACRGRAWAAGPAGTCPRRRDARATASGKSPSSSGRDGWLSPFLESEESQGFRRRPASGAEAARLEGEEPSPASLGEDSAAFSLEAQKRSSWTAFFALLTLVMFGLYALWIDPEQVGLGAQYVASLESLFSGE